MGFKRMSRPEAGEALKILIDTREQTPYCFEKYPVESETAALTAGDYTLAGFQDRIAVERKSLNDLMGCLTGKNRERFEKELARAGSFERFVVVIEADLKDISDGKYKSDMKPHAVLQSITAFFIRYKIPFLFCGNRDGGEYMTHSILQKFYYEIEKRFETLTKAANIHGYDIHRCTIHGLLKGTEGVFWGYGHRKSHALSS